MNPQLFTEWFTRGAMFCREGDQYAPPVNFPSYAARNAFYDGYSHEERYGHPTGEEYAI